MTQWKEAVTAIIQERNQTILERWNAGDRVEDIAVDLGMNTNTIRKIIWEAPDAAPRKRGPKVGSLKPRTREIEQRCRDGASYIDLAQEFGVSRQRITQIAKRAGLDRKHNHVLSSAIVTKKAKEREKREQDKAKRQAEKAAHKAVRQKLMEEAAGLRGEGKSWSEV